MFDCYDTLITPEEVADMLGWTIGIKEAVLRTRRANKTKLRNVLKGTHLEIRR